MFKLGVSLRMTLLKSKRYLLNEQKELVKSIEYCHLYTFRRLDLASFSAGQKGRPPKKTYARDWATCRNKSHL